MVLNFLLSLLLIFQLFGPKAEGQTASEVTTELSEFKTVDFKPGEFIRQALKKLSHDRPDLTLDMTTPSRFQIHRYVGNTGDPFNTGFDFYVVGVLARMFVGGTFYNEAQSLEKIANMSLEEMQKDERFIKAPNAHQQLLAWILSQPDRSIMPHDIMAKRRRGFGPS